MMAIEALTSKILQHFVGETFQEELSDARKSFFERAGILDEQSETYEQRMKQFYDWYLFSRKLQGFGRTPLESVFDIRALRLTEEEQLSVSRLRELRHSLFEFKKVKKEDVYIRDLFQDKTYVVKKSPWIYGFVPKEIFEARLVPTLGSEVKGNSYVFLHGICFHPSQAYKYILAEIKSCRKNPDLDPEDLMLKLCKMRYQMEQYRHITPEMIYSNENQFQVKA